MAYTTTVWRRFSRTHCAPALFGAAGLFRNLGQDAALGLTGGITAADFFNECETSAARPPGASCYGDEFLLDVPFPQAAAHRHRLLRLEVLAAAVATPSYSPVVNVNANLSVEGAVMLVHMWRQAKAYRGTLTAKVCGSVLVCWVAACRHRCISSGAWHECWCGVWLLTDDMGHADHSCPSKPSTAALAACRPFAVSLPTRMKKK